MRSRRVQFASKRRRLLLVRASRGGGVAFEVRGAIFRGGERGRESTRLRLGGVESFGERFRLRRRARHVGGGAFGGILESRGGGARFRHGDGGVRGGRARGGGVLARRRELFRRRVAFARVLARSA